MQPTRFDRLTKGLVHVRSRRDLLHLLAAGSGLGLIASMGRILDTGAQPAAVPPCAHTGQPCGSDDDQPCCSGLLCDGTVCGAPKPVNQARCSNPGRAADGTPCEANHECCSGCCVHTAGSHTTGGLCGVPDPDNVLEECSKVP